MKINDFLLCTFDGDNETPKTNYVGKIVDIDDINSTFDCELMDTNQRIKFQFNLSGIWPGTDVLDGTDYGIDTHDIYTPNKSAPVTDEVAAVTFADTAQYLCFVESNGDSTNVQFYHHPYPRIVISADNTITFSEWDHYVLGDKISAIEACVLTNDVSSSALPSEQFQGKSLDETTQLFKQFELEGEIDFEAFRIAYAGYTKIDNGSCPSHAHWVDKRHRKNKITYDNTTGYLIIIDFTKPSNERRMVILNILNGFKRSHLYVAHGVGSQNKKNERLKARNFSNTVGSNKSSLGFFVTGRAFPRDKKKDDGKIEKRVWLKLYGLEVGINDRALRRGIMMHTASYVSEKLNRAGRSHGCPAISDAENELVQGKLKNRLFEDIRDGNLLFAYTDRANATDDFGNNYYDQSNLLKCLEG
jgi:hypothetical protein